MDKKAGDGAFAVEDVSNDGADSNFGNEAIQEKVAHTLW
jgi:hypothetical protein